jgi:hypothetical protein
VFEPEQSFFVYFLFVSLLPNQMKRLFDPRIHNNFETPNKKSFSPQQITKKSFTKQQTNDKLLKLENNASPQQ